jgi:hypothetical protein
MIDTGLMLAYILLCVKQHPVVFVWPLPGNTINMNGVEMTEAT